MEVLVMVGQLLLALSLLVGIHELGHLLAAKAFGMRVEKYSIGFPPKIWGFKYGETEYSIGAIPLGGFVKISGMVDESLDTKNLDSEPQPWEFRSKPAWQRLIVMMGGIIMNVITGIVIFVMMTYIQGETYVPRDVANQYGIVAYEIGEELGLKTGDKILKINGKDFKKFNDIRSPEVLLGENSSYTVERDGKLIEIPIPGNLIEKFSKKEAAENFVGLRAPFHVDEVQEPAAKEAGLQAGDRIVKVANDSIAYFHEFKALLDKYKGQTVSMQILRDGSLINLDIPIQESGLVGFIPEVDLETARIDYDFAGAVKRGTYLAFNTVWVNIKALGKIFSGELSPQKSIQGPIGIATIYGGSWEWSKFWRITGLLSMVLAFMNFLPIPALDGGHVMFLVAEMVSGRKPSDKFLENAQKVGMVLLLGIMIFAIFNDVVNHWF